MASAAEHMPEQLRFLCAAQSMPAYAESVFSVWWFFGITAVYRACRKGYHPYTLLIAWSSAYCITYAALAVGAASPAISFACLACMHATFGGCIPLTRQLFNAAAPNHIRATLLSAYLICSAVGTVIGQFFTGLALEHFSYGWVWGASTLLFAMLAARILTRPKPHVISR